jgi:hypothetical protein
MSLFCLNFLDKAIERGDDIVLATKPDPTKNLTRKLENGAVEQTGFGREMEYLKSNGYQYDLTTNKMIKGK